jgi:hypothetical protein
MSLDLGGALNSLALGNAMLVAPALGESYAGKTAGSIAALLFVLANGLDARLARQPALVARLEALLAMAPPAALADPSVARALGDVGPASDSPSNQARFDLLMGALVALHAWADSHDQAIAAQARTFLADWSASERLDIPAFPG